MSFILCMCCILYTYVLTRWYLIDTWYPLMFRSWNQYQDQRNGIVKLMQDCQNKWSTGWNLNLPKPAHVSRSFTGWTFSLSKLSETVCDAVGLSHQRPASHRGPRPTFVPFTSGLVTPSTLSNLPCVRGFACCPVRLNWSGSAPELRGLVLMDWERPMGLAVTGGMQRGPQPETERGWNVDFPFWRRHCCAALKSLSAVHRQRCGEQG